MQTTCFSLLTQQTLLSEEESRCLMQENSTRASLQVIQRKWWGNLQRRASKLATQSRRAKMILLAIKIQSNKLSQAKQAYLAGLFREARYYHNYLFSQNILILLLHESSSFAKKAPGR